MDPSRILVRAPNWIGDAVLSLAALRDLRRNFSAAHLAVLARPSVADLYRSVSEVDEVIVSRGFWTDQRELKGRHEIALLLPNSFGSALQIFLARIPERWGYATDGRGPLLTRRASVPREIRGHSQVYYYRAMMAGLGLRVSASPDTRLNCPDSWRETARERLGGGDWIGLSPGASYGSSKRWLPERFAEVADALHDKTGANVVILGARAERPLAAHIASTMRTPARVLCGETTLQELMGVLAHLRLLVTNDSGPMHVAAALGTPLVAVFGPTDSRETAPVSDRARLVREPVPCAPCRWRECPIDHRCMTGVPSDRVIAEALALCGDDVHRSDRGFIPSEAPV